MAILTIFHHSLAGRLHVLPSISHSSLPQCFSTLANHTHLISPPHSQTLFADFAATKFNISAADIARIFKYGPALQKRETLENVTFFVDMLSRYGVTQDQIAEIMIKHPTLMSVNAERLLEPKLQFLKESGVPVKGLASILVRRSNILGLSLERNLQPTMAFLKNVFQTQDLLIKALLRNPFVLSLNLETTLKPSLAFWEGFGLRGKELSRFLSTYPNLLMYSSLTPAQVELISKIGVATDSKMFKYVLLVVLKIRMETLETKIQRFQQCGLTYEETMELFRVAPYVFVYSKEKVCQNMDFLKNRMKLPANSVVKDKILLECNLDKVLKPRFLVWQKLKSMGGHINSKSFFTVLRMREASFVSRIVEEHPESATLYAIYQEALANALSTAKKSTKA